MLIHVCSIYGCFHLQEQGSVVATETIWPSRLKIFTLWPFAEKKKCAHPELRAKHFDIVGSFLASSKLTQFYNLLACVTLGRGFKISKPQFII